MKPPPCIHTMTGFFAAGREVLRPDVQILAVLVRHPVAMREHQLVGAHIGLFRRRADRAPDLRVLDAFPRLHRLRQAKSLGFRIANAEEGKGLALSEAAEFPAFGVHQRRSQIGTCGGYIRRSRRCGGFRFLLTEGLSGNASHDSSEHGGRGPEHRSAIHSTQRSLRRFIRHRASSLLATAVHAASFESVSAGYRLWPRLLFLHAIENVISAMVAKPGCGPGR